MARASTPVSGEALLLPARQAVRAVARARLRRAVEQAARLHVPGEPPATDDATPPATYADDPEAVHDFRVALRRLRSWMRAFRPHLADTVRKKTERRLQRLARIAGRARDLEVQSQWLRALPPRSPALTLAAAHWLEQANGVAYDAARRKLAREVAADFPSLADKLDRQLAHYLLDVDVDAPARERPLGAVMAPLLREHRDAVLEKLAAVQTREQLTEAHAARIAVKRLRYLLEALDDVSRPGRAVVKRLAALQHEFGELHDAQVLADRVAAEIAAGERRRLKRAAAAVEPAADGRPAPRAFASLQRRLARRMAGDATRALRVAHAAQTRQSLATVDDIAARLEREDAARAP